MTRELRRLLASSRAVFVYAAGGALALLAPLLLAAAAEAPAGPGAAVLALALAMVIALGRHHGTLLIGAPAGQPTRWADPHLARAAGVTDPRRHPLRPRAPGPA